jgi:hypothetical protein
MQVGFSYWMMSKERGFACTCHRICFDKDASIVQYNAKQLKSVLK